MELKERWCTVETITAVATQASVDYSPRERRPEDKKQLSLLVQFVAGIGGRYAATGISSGTFRDWSIADRQNLRASHSCICLRAV